MFEFILDWIYPPKCLICRNLIEIHKPRYFCESCLHNIEPLKEPFCIKCGLPANSICSSCNKKEFAFLRNFAAFAYDETFRQMIHQFKYGKRPEYGTGLGQLMAKTVNPALLPEIDRIIPVPIHKKRKRERGFNQSDILAAEISKAWGIPVDYKILTRIKNTKPQSSLGPSGRENNVRDAFAINQKYLARYNAILLIDDIYTTGYTLDACARVLREGVADTVYCLTLAIASGNELNKGTIEPVH